MERLSICSSSLCQVDDPSANSPNEPLVQSRPWRYGWGGWRGCRQGRSTCFVATAYHRSWAILACIALVGSIAGYRLITPLPIGRSSWQPAVLTTVQLGPDLDGEIPHQLPVFGAARLPHG